MTLWDLFAILGMLCVACNAAILVWLFLFRREDKKRREDWFDA